MEANGASEPRETSLIKLRDSSSPILIVAPGQPIQFTLITLAEEPTVIFFARL